MIRRLYTLPAIVTRRPLRPSTTSSKGILINHKSSSSSLLLNNTNNHHFTRQQSFYSTTMSSSESESSQQQQPLLLKLGMCQLNVGSNKQSNIQNAIRAIEQASMEQGAQLITLPECFNCPYGNKYFAEYAEELESSETLEQMSICAKKYKVYIIAGSIPTKSRKVSTTTNTTITTEDDGDNLYDYYNTSVVFDNEGNRIAIHNKVHLFDINVPNKIVFQESAVLTAGQSLTTFDMKVLDKNSSTGKIVKVGLGICFDIRFPEMAQIYQRQGCELLVYPGAFNMTTGPAHWELLCRSRAVDNQLYVCVVSPARDTGADYVAYGHSMICSPWGDVITQMDEKAHVITTEINMDTCGEIRQQIPSIRNRRLDLYDVIYKKQQ